MDYKINYWENVKLTEEIFQKLYKSKIYIRNEEWDVIWYLGGNNNVTVGERDSQFYLLPSKKEGVVTDILPFELIQGENMEINEEPRLLKKVSDLIWIFPEFDLFFSE